MASTLGCIFGCNPPEIVVRNFSLATSKGQHWKFGQQNLADAPASIVLKFEIAEEKQFEFELQRAQIFGKNAVVRIISDVSFQIYMCNEIWRAFTQTRLVILLNKKRKIFNPQRQCKNLFRIYKLYKLVDLQTM